MQQYQLDVLKNISGVDFKFVPADKNKFGVKYYEHKCKTDDEYWNITGLFGKNNVAYSCIEFPDNTCSVIVLENELDVARYDSVRFNRITDPAELKPIGKINGNDVFLEPILTYDNKYSTITSAWDRAIAVVNINGRRLPFYVSSGAAKKDQEYGIPSGKWYPLQGMSEIWLNKMPDMLHNPYKELDEVSSLLEQKFPAAELKQKAAKRELPFADHNSLLQAANFDFPEGVALTEFGNYTYLKNTCVYLPQIINRWRSKPDNFLNVSDGVLASPEQKVLNKVQKLNLLCESRLEGNYIWLYPGDINGGLNTNEEIRKYLIYRLGFNPQVYTEKKDGKGLGFSVDSFKDYFEQQKRKGLEKASAKITENKRPMPEPQQPQKNNQTKSIFQRLKGFLKD